MKISLSIIGVGVIVTTFGIIFQLQGQSIVGPQESFMYSNPDWITYGIEIWILGVSLIAIGIISKIFWKR